MLLKTQYRTAPWTEREEKAANKQEQVFSDSQQPDILPNQGDHTLTTFSFFTLEK